MTSVVCGIDLETTGLDFETDHITEIGYVIKQVGTAKPLAVVSEFISLPADVKIPEIVTDLTGIENYHVHKHGRDLSVVVAELIERCKHYGVEYFVAHNADGFDKPFLERYLVRCFDKVPGLIKEMKWIDTKEDIPYPVHCKATNLTYVAAYHGFLNPFPHAAVFDSMTMLRVLDDYDFRAVVERSEEPWVVVRAMIKPPFRDDAPAGEKEADKAKERRYRFQDCGDGKIYEKCWVKRVKASAAKQEIEEAPFKVVEIKQ